MKEYKNYYDNGKLFQHCWLNEKGKLEGEYKEWHEGGQLATRCFYKDGSPEGEYKSWRGNGQLTAHCFFKNGLRQGEHKHWNFNGIIIIHSFYHDNDKIDITEYVEDVNNITECEYFYLQMIFGYFPILKYNGTKQ